MSKTVAAMHVYRTDAMLVEDGQITLIDLPFAASQRVEITITATESPRTANLYPLRDTPYQYDDPFSPVVDATEWEAVNDTALQDLLPPPVRRGRAAEGDG